MAEKILVGYAGSWAHGMKCWREGKKPREGTPVCISKEKLKKLREWQEMEYCSNWI